MKNFKLHALLSGMILVFFTSCKKDETPPEIDIYDSKTALQARILNDISNNVYYPTYMDMETKMLALHNACLNLNSSVTNDNLEEARNAWKSVRAVWETSEAFLFGPVSTNNIDPSTDTWPVDYNSLDSLLNSSASFTTSFIQSLGDELKGYHPLEYLLWGNNGNKSASDFNSRELEFLLALSTDLKEKAGSLKNSWDPSQTGNYLFQVTNPGNNASVYPSNKAIFEEMVVAMSSICDEVANGKISEPFVNADPSLEESPFSQNSLTDFKNNIIGVSNVYYGKYSVDGFGIHSFLEKHNLTLHGKITGLIDNAIKSFDGITVPFGQAITQQPTQVQNTIDQINLLKNSLENELLPFMQMQIEK